MITKTSLKLLRSRKPGERAATPPSRRLGIVPETGAADRKAAPAGATVAPRSRARRPTDSLPPQSLATRAEFDALAKKEDKPGAAFAATLKFLVTEADTSSPKLWLIDGHKFDYHWDFAVQGLGLKVSLDDFNHQTYWNDHRKNIAGYIVAHDSFVDGSKKGAYAVEFWPADTVHHGHVVQAFQLIKGAMPFTRGKLAYHPASDTQEDLARTEAAALKKKRVPVVTTEKLFENVSYSPLNPGEGFGVLRIVLPGAAGPPPSARDVCVFAAPPPNDLSHVAGIISSSPQTPLSHVNLKAKQNHTPNAYVKGASDDPKIKALAGKIARFEVTPDGYTLAPATQAEADAYLDRVRPKQGQSAPRDLAPKKIVAFAQLGAGDARAFGAKTANVAELRKVLDGGVVPDGFGIPFSFYDAFMRSKSLEEEKGISISPYSRVRKMMADPRFKADAGAREAALAELQKALQGAPLPARIGAQIADLQARLPAGASMRCRSSTNNEDLAGFNGAGLYDSYTFRPKKRARLEDTVKKVWASLWNFRAFEERDFWRIDHLKAAMGVTVHPNVDDEPVNGVALTKNPFDARWRGFYINAQVGENLVTNPTDGAVPEEMLVAALGEHEEYETQRIRRSNLNGGAPVLTVAQIKELVDALARIHDHFARVYGKTPDDPSFGMDVEWKFTKEGKLWIKQARPVVA